MKMKLFGIQLSKMHLLKTSAWSTNWEMQITWHIESKSTETNNWE